MKFHSEGELLALDLGASKFAYGLTSGALPPRITKFDLPRLGDPAAEFALVAELLSSDASTFRGTPVFCVAPSLSESGLVESWPNRQYWRGFALLDSARGALGAELAFVGDGEAVALADAGDEPDTVYVSLYFGTGVAGGIARDRNVFETGPLNAELGHIVTDTQSRSCPCGLRGCFQTSWIAFRDGMVGHDVFADNLARLVSILAAVFPRCVITLGGRFFSEDPLTAEAFVDRVRRVTGTGERAPLLRRSDAGPNAPLVGSLMIAEKLKGSHAVTTP